MCDITIAGRNASPAPFLECPLQCSARKGWGGGETGSANPSQQRFTGYRSPPLRTPKMATIMTLKRAGDVLFPYPSYQHLRVFLHAQADRHAHRQTNKQDTKNHTQKTPTRTARKKKNARRVGLDPAKDAEHKLRVESVVFVRNEETQWESQTPKHGFGFPQHLRERERKDKDKRRRRTSQQQEKWAHKHQCKQRANLKRHRTKQKPDPIDQITKHTIPTFSRKTQNNKATRQSNKVSEDLSQHGGGAHGPPCGFWGDTPGDRGTEGSEDPPTTGTAPGGARISLCRKRYWCPTKWARLLAGPAKLLRPQSQSTQEA